MTQANQTLRRRLSADERLAQRILFDAIWAVAWRALGRHNLSHADRQDVAQEAVIAAWRGRGRYSADRGNPEQWLSRIVRNSAYDFLSARGRDPLVLGIERDDVPGEELPMDDRLCLRDLAEQVFAALPEGERRAVIAIAIEGQSLREVAVAEGVSPSTVSERYQRGIATLRAAHERGESSKLFGLFPMAPADDDPPPEVVERAWQRAVVELGLDSAPESEPPPSGTRRSTADDVNDIPPSGRLGRGLWDWLGPLGGVLLGAAIATFLSTYGRGCAPESARAEQSRPVMIATVSAVISSPKTMVDADPPLVGSVSGPETAGAKGVAPHNYRDPFDAERALLDRGQSALAAGDIEGVLTRVTEHAARFPQGQNVSSREALWDQACAAERRRRARGLVDERCAGRP